MSPKNAAYVAMSAVILCVCSWLTIPFTVPFTMQTFGVYCALLILGGRRGLAAIGLYLLLGIVGLPVFSGFRGGLGHVLGPTGGYILGFLFTGLAYLLLEKRLETLRWLPVVGLGKGKKLKKPTRVAVVDLGWANGIGALHRGERQELPLLRKARSILDPDDKFEPVVKVGGKKVPVLGQTGMTALTLNVTRCECAPRDVAVLDADPRMVRFPAWSAWTYWCCWAASRPAD